MALNDSQKQSVVFYLGWPGKVLVASSTHYNNTVVSRLTNLTSEIESRTVSILTKLACLDEKLEGAASRLAAKRVDTVETNPEEIRMLKSERRRLCRELSTLLDIAFLAPNGSMVGVCS